VGSDHPEVARMKAGFRSRFGRTVAAALVVAASVVGPSLVAADGDPVEPTPKPLFCTDLSAPAGVVLSVLTTGVLILDATSF
jgi:hypothetical protein